MANPLFTAGNEAGAPASSKSPPTAGVYIHIPFCRAKCVYCDFYSLADRDEAMDRFMHCLAEEIHRSADGARSWRVDTLYIGGGTPSLLAPCHLESIMTALQQALHLDQPVEFTLEANPGEAPVRAARDLRSETGGGAGAFGRAIRSTSFTTPP